jgi:hypothetical protein
VSQMASVNKSLFSLEILLVRFRSLFSFIIYDRSFQMLQRDFAVLPCTVNSTLV